MTKITELYDLEHTQAREYLSAFVYPWEALQGIKEFILRLGKTLSPAEYEEISPGVWVHKTAKIAPTAYLGAPCVIGAETEVTSSVSAASAPLRPACATRWTFPLCRC